MFYVRMCVRIGIFVSQIFMRVLKLPFLRKYKSSASLNYKGVKIQGFYHLIINIAIVNLSSFNPLYEALFLDCEPIFHSLYSPAEGFQKPRAALR